jgi:hypothetical protein
MKRLMIVALLIVGVTATAVAQRGQRGRAPRGGDYKAYNVPYDGRFTFVRLRFTPAAGRRGFGRGGGQWWDHDYPRAERNFAKILSEVSHVQPYMGGSNILSLDDPELYQYPVAYMSEPGHWALTESEAQGLRDYLLKGGFVIFDDFAGYDWYNFAEQMGRVLPEARLLPMEESHPIFDAFFRIENLDGFVHPNYNVTPEFFGIFEDNDPNKRLMAIVNYNNDIGDYWEWSDAGFLPIDLSNEAYKLGVNYIVYAMTH